jgi:hypothetical protein
VGPWLEATVPKAPRGRRPAPNPKKRAPRHTPRSLGMAPSYAGAESANGGGAATAVAPRPTTASGAAWPSAARRAATPAVPRRRFSESIADYAYVADDLRRIAMLAGGLVVLMVVLSFIIR